MMILCANHSSRAFITYARAHPGKLGWIISPQCWKEPKEGIPYALDNGAFSAWKNGTIWDIDAWRKMLDKAMVCGQKPIWGVVPDVVCNKDLTLEKWYVYRYSLTCRGIPTALAVQDGMFPSDVPTAPKPDVIFVGGSTFWKWKTLPMWCKHFPRVHVGRVRTRKLEVAERCGAESVDGTGFMRETFHGRPMQLLRNFIEGHRNGTPEMSFTDQVDALA